MSVSESISKPGKHTIDASERAARRPIYHSVWGALLQQIRRRQRLRAWLLRKARTKDQNMPS